MSEKLYTDWQETCTPLEGSFFFDHKANAITIILRSPMGVEQVGTVSKTLELSAFTGLRLSFLDNLTATGWTWKLAKEGF